MFRRFVAGVFTGGTATAIRHSRCAYASDGAQGVFTPLDVLSTDGDGTTTYDYDLVVIGGGSGGLAAAKRAADHGAKVALCDFVTPSPQGTTWGLGGTCVNVGCIPKKLMHAAALQGEMMEKSVRHFGWYAEGEREGCQGVNPSSGEIEHAPKMKCDWSVLQLNVENHIRSLNFGYSSQLMQKKVKLLRAKATFKDAHTLECTTKAGTVSTVTARRVLLATGGRPTIPDGIPGAKEHGITSDDIFRLKRDPGKTCVIGASYVALECAGFLHGIGRPTSVMMRSIPLRGFDQGMANLAVSHMEKCGIDFHKGCVPVEVKKRDSDGKLEVTMESWETGTQKTEVFDTVLFATGRTPDTKTLNLAKVGVKVSRSGHVVTDKHERSSLPHVYAIGDIKQGGLELTPVAIKAGHMLADRLYNKGKQILDYKTVPTTVFTPLEYGCVGLSEENAVKRTEGGADGIEVYHTHMTPLEWSLAKADLEQNSSYVKVIVEKKTDLVLGFHILSPNAGEITQGFAVAIKKGLTRAELNDTIGIHPTIAEDGVNLTITKSSGESAEKGGC